MYDLEILLDDCPGTLSRMGKTLGDAGVSVEGGGAWVVGGRGFAHFLVAEDEPAITALRSANIEVAGSRKVVVQRLRQGRPGQLGALTGRMAEAGVNIAVLYSDHDNNLIIVPDNHAKAEWVADRWMQDNWGSD